MRFLFVAIWGAIAYALYPSGIFSIPFAQLTLGNVFCFIGAALFGLFALIALFQE